MTPKILADALGCFWNAAIWMAHNRRSETAMEVATVMAEGVAAVAARLEEHDQGESRRITELLEANNRFEQEARDCREALAKIAGATEDDGLAWAKAVALEALKETVRR